MADIVGEPELINSSSAVTTADDADGIAIGDCLSDGFGAFVHRWFFKHAHRSVPNDGLGRLDDISVLLRGFRSDVQTFHVVRDLARSDNLLVATSDIAEVVTAVRVDGKLQLVAALCHQFLRQIDLVFFDQ